MSLFPHLRILHVHRTCQPHFLTPPTPPDFLVHLVRVLRSSPLLLLNVDVECDLQLLPVLRAVQTELPSLRALRLSEVRRLRHLMRLFCYQRKPLKLTHGDEWMVETRERASNALCR